MLAFLDPPSERRGINFKTVSGLSPRNGQNLACTVFHVPYSLDSHECDASPGVALSTELEGGANFRGKFPSPMLILIHRSHVGDWIIRGS